jgi:hypothetical protein
LPIVPVYFPLLIDIPESKAEVTAVGPRTATIKENSKDAHESQAILVTIPIAFYIH